MRQADRQGRVYYGAAFTTIKDLKKEIGAGLLSKMLDDLGLTKDDLKADIAAFIIDASDWRDRGNCLIFRVAAFGT